MKKGILQRVSKNWEEAKMAPPPPEIKQEPLVDYPEPLTLIVLPLEPQIVKPIAQRQTETKKGQRESMIIEKKDYSYKYSAMPKTPTTSEVEDSLHVNISQSAIASPTLLVQSNKTAVRQSPAVLKSRDAMKRSMNSIKSPISILERRDYDKGPSKPKLIKIENKPQLVPAASAIASSKKTISPAHRSHKTHVPSKQIEAVDNLKCEEVERERLKVVFAQKVENPVVKQEFDAQSLKATPIEPKDPQNINKINNKINIIFQLNDNTKSLRKNIILHRRAPKKMVQKITIKEANNNTKIQTEEPVLVPERVVCSIDTQTETHKQTELTFTTTNPLSEESTEYLFFDDNADILISLQQTQISFFEFNRLGSLLKKGETDFKLIDRVPRRLHDTLIDSPNNFQRLCYNDQNDSPIYVEMRAKQKELDDPEMCPIAFLYCNVYYIDQRRAKFSSVHLDTVKSVIRDIIYTTVPESSYFIMAWNEMSPDTKDLVTGIVKYKLTPNLDLAKLASIRQFPKLNYRTKQMSCGKNSQLVTFGESQVSIFNYESGDLLMSLDLMKSYGTNLTTFEFRENYLFMVYLADEGPSTKRVIVIGVNKFEGNTFKVIQSTPLKLRKGDTIASQSITSTNHLLVTLSSGSVFMMNLLNFRDIHFHASLSNESIYAAGNYLLPIRNRNIGLRNFTEFFLN